MTPHQPHTHPNQPAAAHAPAHRAAPQVAAQAARAQPQPASVSTSAERRRWKEQVLRDFFSPAVQAERYRVEKVIGEGAYGVVVAAMDMRTNQRVAVKRIKRVLDSAAMATRILRELKFLRHLSKHENVIAVLDVLIPGERDRFNDVFVVFELMPTDLGRLLRSKTVLTEHHTKFFLFQLLRAVRFLHATRVFHRDLNPQNILVDADCQLRVCDFGLARAAFQSGDDHVFWTDYVATRWYRAPELILAHSATYSTAIDMWSVGCIFAEMLGRGKPLFPGNNAYHQFALIVNVTGRPSPDVVASLNNPGAAEHINSLPVTPTTSLESLYPDASPEAISLLSQLLAFDPSHRITAEQALMLPYFSEFWTLGLGLEATPLNEEEFQFERRRPTSQDMRLEFINEIAAHHPEARDELLSGVGQGMRYMAPSAAEQFRADMDAPGGSGAKSRTLTSDQFVAVNPETAPPRVAESMEYKSSTLGEAELAKYDLGPAGHNKPPPEDPSQETVLVSMRD